MKWYINRIVLWPLMLAVVSCGDNGSTITPPTNVAPPIVPPPPPPPPPPVPEPTEVTISGKISFDLVPHDENGNLDHANTRAAPARGVTVEAIDVDAVNEADNMVATGTTDAQGDYSVVVPANTNVRILVQAELLQTTGAQWDIKVTDNTNGNAVYVLEGGDFNSGIADATRDLHAVSGWTVDGSTNPDEMRPAGPFAILDSAYDTVQKFADVDPDVNFPPVEFRWSVNNKPSIGINRAIGDIGTSLFDPSDGNLYILGDANTDTDEYDSHVIIHEWGHYYENMLSRADTIGGPHGLGNLLDPRVALAEGWGNALAAIISDDPFYKDSPGLIFTIETPRPVNLGWYNEFSVHSIIYDIYDSDDDGADVVSAGLGPIHETLTSEAYKNQDLFTTIYSFIHYLGITDPNIIAADVASIVRAQDIFGVGEDGAGETNSDRIDFVLPVYKDLVINGSAVRICSGPNSGNGLGVYAYLRLSVETEGEVVLTMTPIPANVPPIPGNLITHNPGFLLYSRPPGSGPEQRTTFGANDDTPVTMSPDLAIGTHVIAAYDWNNLTRVTSGFGCYNFSATQVP